MYINLITPLTLCYNYFNPNTLYLGQVCPFFFLVGVWSAGCSKHFGWRKCCCLNNNRCKLIYWETCETYRISFAGKCGHPVLVCKCFGDNNHCAYFIDSNNGKKTYLSNTINKQFKVKYIIDITNMAKTVRWSVIICKKTNCNS